jgi:hypothetical protein
MRGELPPALLRTRDPGARNIQRRIPLAQACFAALLVLFVPAHVAASPVGTPSSGSVTQSGAFSYSIPFRLPPGTAGVAPKLGLSYSSQGGNGIAGMGWNLSGLSVIMRCPRIPAIDGVLGSINLDANDRLCLDGQRLVVNSGSYGTPGAIYFTELFNGARITQLAARDTAAPPKAVRTISYRTSGGTRRALSPELIPGETAAAAVTFRAETRAGEAMDYIAADIDGPNRMWLLSRVVDVRGNYWGITYDRNSATGEYRVLAIDYTGNEATAPVTAPYNRVEFGYEARPDPIYSHIAGYPVSNTQRLTTVTTSAAGVPVTRYTLGYEAGNSPATARSRLASVQECGYTASATWNCLQPTTFNYSGDPPGPFIVESWTGHGGLFWDEPSQSYKNNFVGDFDGDGKSDMAAWTRSGGNWHIALSRAGNFENQIWSGPGVQDVFLGDFNADGKTDLLAYNGVPVGNWHVALSTGTGFDNQSWQGGHGGGTTNNIVADFNGDGRTDIAAYAGPSQWHICLSTGSGWSCAIWAGHGGGLENNAIGDFNGDGMADLAGHAGGGVWSVCLSTGSSFNCVAWTGHGQQNPAYNHIGDYNGDGKADMMAFDTTFNGWNVCLSTGANFSCSIWAGAGSDANIILGDFNGDGLTDGAGFINTTLQWNVCLATGTRFNCTVRTATGDSALNAFVGDYNGDGMSDIGAYTGANGVWQMAFPAGPQVDLMTKVTSSMGLVTQISTRPLSSTDRYITTGEPAVAYPLAVVAAPVPVVVTLVSDNGIGSTNTVDYTYGRALNSLDGRGLLGFRWQDTVDQRSGITSRTQFMQAWPFTGSAESQGSWTAGYAQQIKSATATFAAKTLLDPVGQTCSDGAVAGQPVITYASASTERSWDIDAALSPFPGTSTSTTVDCFGHPTQIQVNLLDGAGVASGYSKLTVNTIENWTDAGRWMLNRLKTTRVTSTIPASAVALPTAPSAPNASAAPR